MLKKSLLGLFIFMSVSSLMGMQQENSPTFYVCQQHAANIVMQKRYQWLQGSLLLLPFMTVGAVIYKYSNRNIDLFEGALIGSGFAAVTFFVRQIFNDIVLSQNKLREENTQLRTQLGLNK